ncbi:unnamed protein product [Peronospora destructor]|uniref:Protein kinase domain-containing protein n=1 Tax=Peronospora destructor TaxID=86335 RepID=A0AAV0V5Y2_9STRA|nr:unnamed protein product [Peronospora destructor]
MDVSHYVVEHVARQRDLAVVSGRETIRNAASGRRFRHLWKHELRFEADGRISHINILADKTAAAVAFANGGGSGPRRGSAGEATGLSLAALPREREQQASTCPPGEIRVVCISGKKFQKRKPTTGGGSGYKVVIGLNEFPHVTAKVPGPNRIGRSSSRDAITTNTDGLSHVGLWKSYSTRVVKSSGEKGPYWAETLYLEFSGAVPEYLHSSEGTEEEIASVAVPKWFDIYRTESFASGTREDNESSGRLELSISFAPYSETDDLMGENDDISMSEDGEESGLLSGGSSLVQGSRSPRYRKSFDRLQELHKETGQNQRGSERYSLAGSDTPGGCELETQDKKTLSEDAEMYSFTVASTKFRVHRRYQLIRAIGHGAYGVVIAASDQITGNSVAIKNVPRTFDDLVDAKRIVREIRLMRHLCHPHVISLLDVMRPRSLVPF